MMVMAGPVQAVLVHYSFVETAPGNWTVSATVSGADTAGLSAYGLWVYDNAAVSYAENNLGTLDGIGFLPGNLVAGYIFADFNAGNYQTAGAYAIQDIGINPVYIASPPITVDLGVPALLGTLTTPTGLGEADFGPDGAGLLNATNDGYLTEGEITITYEVLPLPEPATLGILFLGGLALLRRSRK